MNGHERAERRVDLAGQVTIQRTEGGWARRRVAEAEGRRVCRRVPGWYGWVGGWVGAEAVQDGTGRLEQVACSRGGRLWRREPLEGEARGGVGPFARVAGVEEECV